MTSYLHVKVILHPADLMADVLSVRASQPHPHSTSVYNAVPVRHEPMYLRRYSDIPDEFFTLRTTRVRKRKTRATHDRPDLEFFEVNIREYFEYGTQVDLDVQTPVTLTGFGRLRGSTLWVPTATEGLHGEKSWRRYYVVELIGSAEPWEDRMRRLHG